MRKLRAAGVIEAEARVVLMLTGSGMKDSEVLRFHPSDVREVALGGVESALSGLLGSGRM